jgi:non-ribosomal peptide synthase protein (TIGR01720 family)
VDHLPTLIKMVKEDLRRLPHKGTGYGILRYLTADELKSTLDFSLMPEISFNYLGQFDSEVETSFFQPSAFDMGHQMSPESQSPYALNFSGIVRSGRLIISCSFIKQEYLLGTITKRIDGFKHHLLTLIHHCASKEERDFTPSDFSANDLQMDEVGDIMDILSEKLH